MPFDFAPHYTPTDHLRHTEAYYDAIKVRIGQFAGIKALARAIETTINKQPKGALTDREGRVLAAMIRQNAIACVWKRRTYRPTRKRLARGTGLSVRTVSTALTKLKAAGIVVVERYGKGGRNGDRGQGLATEFRAGCMQFLADQLAALGYRLPASLRAEIEDWGRWAAEQLGERVGTMDADTSPPGPTGKLLPGIVCVGNDTPARAEAPASASVDDRREDPGNGQAELPASCNERDGARDWDRFPVPDVAKDRGAGHGERTPRRSDPFTSPARASTGDNAGDDDFTEAGDDAAFRYLEWARRTIRAERQQKERHDDETGPGSCDQRSRGCVAGCKTAHRGAGRPGDDGCSGHRSDADITPARAGRGEGACPDPERHDRRKGGSAAGDTGECAVAHGDKRKRMIRALVPIVGFSARGVTDAPTLPVSLPAGVD